MQTDSISAIDHFLRIRYVSEEWAFSSGMAYVNPANQAVMQVDHWSTLTQGQARNSIRIESQQIFNKGLFILVRLGLKSLWSLRVLRLMGN
jgi:hypothetical protein